MSHNLCPLGDSSLPVSLCLSWFIALQWPTVNSSSCHCVSQSQGWMPSGWLLPLFLLPSLSDGQLLNVRIMTLCGTVIFGMCLPFLVMLEAWVWRLHCVLFHRFDYEISQHLLDWLQSPDLRTSSGWTGTRSYSNDREHPKVSRRICNNFGWTINSWPNDNDLHTNDIPISV